MACPLPPGLSNCPPQLVYSMGGATYFATQLCDTNGTQVIAVFELCDGEITGVPSYYTLAGVEYVPVGVPAACDASGTTPVDYEVLCDFGTNPATRMFGLWNQGSPPTMIFYVVSPSGALTEYSATGPVGSCSSPDIETVAVCYVATIDGTGYSAGDVLTQVMFWDTSQTPQVLAGTVWRNEAANTTLAGTPLFSDLIPCDSIPPRDCIPSSDVALSGVDCTPSTVPAAVVDALSPITVNIDDPDMDGLCDGAVSISPESFPPPFPVNEPARGPTSGFTLFGDAALTASPAGGNIDTNGTGWLRLTRDVSAVSGVAIVNTPFPSTTAIDFEYTFATYSENPHPSADANQADGHVFMLLDGNTPVPSGPGGLGGALGYASVGATPGIANAVLGIGVHEYPSYAGSNGGGVVGTGGQPGPFSAGANAVTVRGSGNGGVGGDGGYQWLSTTQVPSGETVGQHNRNNPVKVRGTLEPAGAQSTLNIAMDFGDGYVPVVTNLVINQTLPTNLRFGFGAANGAAHNFHLIRDIVVAPSARRHWRQYTFNYDGLPDCATSFNATATLNYTITSDTQSRQGGDNDNEHFIGWAIEDPAGVYTWLAQQWIKSAPTDVGVEHEITLPTGIFSDPASLANMRLVIGAETVDLNGEYGVRFNLIQADLVASGCPTEVVKTLPISAPCPIPVTIVGGSFGGGGSGTSIAATVNTVSIEPVCSDLGTIFRREVRDPSGTPKIDFLGTDGQTVSPSTWQPGACLAEEGQIELVQLCDEYPGVCEAGNQVVPANWTYVGNVTSITENVLIFVDGPNPPPAVATQSIPVTGGFTYSLALTIESMGTGPESSVVLVEVYDGATVLVSDTVVSLPAQINPRSYPALTPSGNELVLSVTKQDEFGVNTDVTAYDFDLQCIATNNVMISVPFMRRICANCGSDSTPIVADFTLDGVTPYTVQGEAILCVSDAPPVVFHGEFILCDAGNANTRFIRKYIQDAAGSVTDVVDFALDGTEYVPAGPVVACDCAPVVMDEVCVATYFIDGDFTGDWADATILGQSYASKPEFGGSDIPFTLRNTGAEGDVMTLQGTALNTAIQAGTVVRQTLKFSRPIYIATLRFLNFDATQGDQIRNITPPPVAITGYTTNVTLDGVDASATPDGFEDPDDPYPPNSLFITYGDLEGPAVYEISWDYQTSGGAGDLTFASMRFVPLGEDDPIPGVRVRNCDSTISVYSKATGEQLTTDWLHPIIDCPDEVTSVAEFILCDTLDGVSTAFIRKIRQNAAGEVINVIDLSLDGGVHIVAGTVGQCTDCTPTVLGQVCYSPPIAGATVSDDWAGSTLAGSIWTNSNFGGQGIVVTDTITPLGGSNVLTSNGVRQQSPAANTLQHHHLDLGANRLDIVLRFQFFGTSQGERLLNFSPAPVAVSGQGTLAGANVMPTAADGTVDITFAGPIQTIDWDYHPTGTGLSVQSTIAFRLLTTETTAPATVVRNCDGTISTYDAASGTLLTPGSFVVVDCPAAGSVGEFVLCDDNGSFIRKFIQDAEGAVTSTVDLTLAGAPYAPVGAVVNCAEPCRSISTQILCDSVGDVSEATTSLADVPGSTWFDGVVVPAGVIVEGGQTLWDGGLLGIPGSAAPPAIQHSVVAARLTASNICGGIGTATIGASLRAINDGPTAGVGTTGRFRLMNGTTQIATSAVLNNAGVGAVNILTIAPTVVQLADILAGNIYFVLDLETFETGAKSWTVDQFAYTATAFTVTGDSEGCGPRFIRTSIRDCQTGELLNTLDTELDGVTPYVPVGPVVECSGTPGDATPITLCDVTTEDDGSPTITPFLRRIVLDADGNVARVVDTTLDGVTSYATQGEVTACDVTPDTCCCETIQLCDQGLVLQPVGTGDYEPIPYPVANGPTGGLLPVTGVNWTVDQGVMGGSATYLINNGTVQTWTFDQPVMLRFGVRNLNVGNECIEMPVGTILESLSPNHSWNPVTRRVCNSGAGAGDTSIFTIGPVTELPLLSTASGGGSRGTNYMGVAIPVYLAGNQPFLRRICSGGAVVTDTLVDGVTPYEVTGEVSICQTEQTVPMILCDITAGVVTTFVRHYTYAGGEIVALADTGLDGTPYTPAGTVTDCNASVDDVVLTGIARHVGDVAPIDYKVAYPGLQSITVTVIAGTVGINASSNAGMGAVALPAGTSHTWSVGDVDDSSLDFMIVDPQVGGDVIVIWTYKATSAG